MTTPEETHLEALSQQLLWREAFGSTTSRLLSKPSLAPEAMATAAQVDARKFESPAVTELDAVEGAAAIPRPNKSFHLTDSGNAERFADQHAGKVRYLSSWKSWIVWKGERWAEDSTGAIIELAKGTVCRIYGEASRETDAGKRAAIVKWAVISEKPKRVSAMLSLASSVPGLAVDVDPLDLLLNTTDAANDLWREFQQFCLLRERDRKSPNCPLKARKLALLHACSRAVNTVDLEAAEWGRKLSMHLTEKLASVGNDWVSETEHEERCKRVYRFVKGRPGGACSFMELVWVHAVYEAQGA